MNTNKAKTYVKICGITSVDQARQIAELGVDAIGIISVKDSPRYVSRQIKRKIFQYLKQFFPDIKRVSVIKNIPLGRLATESDVATAVVYLASNGSSMITGSSIVVDGGWTAK